MKKLTESEVLNIIKSKGYDIFGEFNYIESKLSKINIIDKNGYKYSTSLSNIRDSRTKHLRTFDVRNKYTIENIKNYIKLNNLSCELISNEYKSCRHSRLEFKCECGKHYFLALNTFIQAKQFQCDICGTLRGSELHKNNIENIFQIIKDSGYLCVEGENQISTDIRIEDKNGYRYKTTIYNIINRNDKFERFKKSNPYRMYNINKYINENNLDIEILEYKENFDVKFDKIKIKCSCGNIYFCTWSEVISSNRHRCEICSKRQSTLSLEVENYLKEKNIEYLKEKTFKDCKNKNLLPFDFYLIDYNILIEVDGEGHYFPCNFNKCSDEKATISFERIKHTDFIKTKYCKDNNIPLLRIPYWNIKNKNKEKIIYKELIDNILG